jgi:hypothetical protein
MMRKREREGEVINKESERRARQGEEPSASLFIYASAMIVAI